MAMQKNAVESSSITTIGYDPETRVLEVEFKNGKLYRGQDVSPNDATDFLNAESVGRHFNEKIKGNYELTKVDPEKEVNGE